MQMQHIDATTVALWFLIGGTAVFAIFIATLIFGGEQ